MPPPPSLKTPEPMTMQILFISRAWLLTSGTFSFSCQTYLLNQNFDSCFQVHVLNWDSRSAYRNIQIHLNQNQCKTQRSILLHGEWAKRNNNDGSHFHTVVVKFSKLWYNSSDDCFAVMWFIMKTYWRHTVSPLVHMVYLLSFFSTLSQFFLLISLSKQRIAQVHTVQDKHVCFLSALDTKLFLAFSCH